MNTVAVVIIIVLTAIPVVLVGAMFVWPSPTIATMRAISIMI